MSSPIPSYPWPRLPAYWRRVMEGSIRLAYEFFPGTGRTIPQSLGAVHTEGPGALEPSIKNCDVDPNRNPFTPAQQVEIPPGAPSGIWYRAESAPGRAWYRLSDRALYTRTTDHEGEDSYQLFDDDEYVTVWPCLRNASVHDFDNPSWVGASGDVNPPVWVWMWPRTISPSVSLIALTRRGSVRFIGSESVPVKAKGEVLTTVVREQLWNLNYPIEWGTLVFPFRGIWDEETTWGEYPVFPESELPVIGDTGIMLGFRFGGSYELDSEINAGLLIAGSGWHDVSVSPMANAPLGLVVSESSYRLFGHFVLGYISETQLAGEFYHKLRCDEFTRLDWSLSVNDIDPLTISTGAAVWTNDIDPVVGADPTIYPADPLSRWYSMPTADQFLFDGSPYERTMKGRVSYWLSEDEQISLMFAMVLTAEGETEATAANDYLDGYSGPNSTEVGRRFFPGAGTCATLMAVAFDGITQWEPLAGEIGMSIEAIEIPASDTVFTDLDLLDWRVCTFPDPELTQDLPGESGYFSSPLLAAGALLLTKSGELYLHRRNGRVLIDASVFCLTYPQPLDQSAENICQYRKRDGTAWSVNLSSLELFQI